MAALAAVLLTTRDDRDAAPVRQKAHRRSSPALDPPGPIPGYLLIADRGNNRMLLVDSAHHILWRYPRPGTSPAMPFRFDDDTFFGPGADRVISNQEEQHTIQVISFPGGRLLWRYGHVDARGSATGYLNTPDDAYLLKNGLVSVADAYNCRVLFISPAHRVVRRYGNGICAHDPPRELGAINGATPMPDGGTLISEITGSWVDYVNADGTLRWAVRAPVTYPSDPQLLAPNRILLADYARPGAALIMTSRGRVLWRYAPRSGPGELDHPSLAFRIAPGLIAINDDYRHRVVIVDLHKRRIVWQYGHTDVPGRRNGYLNTPDGLDLLPTASAARTPLLRRLLAQTPRVRAPRATPRAAAASPVFRPAPYRLPAPVEREVGVAAGGSVLLAGGLDAAGQSTSGVFRVDAATGRLARLGSMPQVFHDATGALVGGRLLVFGGGAAQSSATVQSFDLRTHRAKIIGRLPVALSDLASATIGRWVYLVGGFDGTAPRREIYRTLDGRHFTIVGRLPVGLRYAAVTSSAGKLIVAGGVSPNGPTDAVELFDPRTGHVAPVAHLPYAVAHAAAVSVGGSVYVVGGALASGAASTKVIRLSASGGSPAVVAGPVAVSDAAAVVVGKRALLFGGRVAGRATARVYETSG